MPELNPAISRFYHRWHALEQNLGEKIEILDFDYCPREHLTDLEKPFSDRLEALGHLETLQRKVEDTGSNILRNPVFLADKLAGSAAFLRALMGQRYSFDVYLRETMGIEPEIIPHEQLSSMRVELEVEFSEIEIPFTPEGKEIFDETTLIKDLSHFETGLRSEALRWVDNIQRRVGLSEEPKYKVEFVNEDAYWMNWIDGSIVKGIRLRVNKHERITYSKGSETGLAVHEIGGHALQILELASPQNILVDSSALNLTVHTCEQFQFEGLAQTVMFLVANDGEIPGSLILWLKLKLYHDSLLNNAQIEVELGRPVDTVSGR